MQYLLQFSLDWEANRLRGVLQSLENKRERLMDLALDGAFGKDEIAVGPLPWRPSGTPSSGNWTRSTRVP